MALIATRNDIPYKNTINNIYVRIKDVALIPLANQVVFSMEYYLDKEAREQSKTSNQVMPLSQFNFGCTIEELGITNVEEITNKNTLLTLAYDYIKNHFGFPELGYEDDI